LPTLISSVLCRITADFVHFVYDTVSIRLTTTKINLCEHVLHSVTRELFLDKMLQKLLKYFNRWRSYSKN